jgi:subtilisin family serine protease
VRARPLLAVLIIAMPTLLTPTLVAQAPLGAPTRVAILAREALPLATVGGDPRVGFVVVETRDVGALRATYGDRVVLDARAWAASAPDDPLWTSQWGPQALDMADAWDLENGSESVKVAVIDSGIDTTHPDLQGVPIENGTDYVQDGATPPGLNGHGTHVAGIVAAARDNGIGVAGIARVTLLSIRVLSADGSGSCLDVALAVLEATARGASIVNLSLQCGTDFAPLHLAIQSATQAGVLVVAAAGNNALNGGACPSFPASYGEVLAVAALQNATALWPNSCSGPSIELAAPGADVLSTWPGGGYAYASGTSMAAPQVSGIAALVKSRFPDINGTELRARLDATATDIGSGVAHGRVNPVAALAAG